MKKQKRSVTKRILKFNYYKNSLFKNEIILKSQQRFKREAYCVYNEWINKIAISSNDDKDYKILIELQNIHLKQMLSKVCEKK